MMLNGFKTVLEASLKLVGLRKVAMFGIFKYVIHGALKSTRYAIILSSYADIPQ